MVENKSTGKKDHGADQWFSILHRSSRTARSTIFVGQATKPSSANLVVLKILFNYFDFFYHYIYIDFHQFDNIGWQCMERIVLLNLCSNSLLLLNYSVKYTYTHIHVQCTCAS
jgi:hypothetical protein